MKIQKEFYLRDDVVAIAKDLLGKYLLTRINGEFTAGIITETEAYEGETDRASHAWNGRRTDRTEVMYREGGVAYVYLCYGIHSLFNIVTNRAGIPHAILVRGILPAVGIPVMLKRIGKSAVTEAIGNGPGRVSRILGIHYSDTGTNLTGEKIWLEDRGIAVTGKMVETTTRIGVQYAREDALLPFRFLVDPGSLKLL